MPSMMVAAVTPGLVQMLKGGSADGVVRDRILKIHRDVEAPK